MPAICRQQSGLDTRVETDWKVASGGFRVAPLISGKHSASDSRVSRVAPARLQ